MEAVFQAAAAVGSATPVVAVSPVVAAAVVEVVSLAAAVMGAVPQAAVAAVEEADFPAAAAVYPVAKAVLIVDTAIRAVHGLTTSRAALPALPGSPKDLQTPTLSDNILAAEEVRTMPRGQAAFRCETEPRVPTLSPQVLMA